MNYPTPIHTPSRKPSSTRLFDIVFCLVALLALFVTAPATADIDLVIQSVQWLEGPTVGNCNKIRIQIRNQGSELGNAITGATLRIFPSNNSFQTVYTKNAYFSSFQPGQTQTREIANIEIPAGGPYTLQVSADADPANGVGKLAESSENNNTYTQNSFSPQGSCGGGECDILATAGSGGTVLPPSYPAKPSFTFKNIGGASCPSKQVTVVRYAGTSPSGSSTTIGTVNLQALNPGKYKSLSWTDNNHPDSGSFTYMPTYGGGLSDANNGNHSPTKTITFKGKTPTGGGGGTSGCDLEATFLAPSGSSASAGSDVQFQVRFRNVGNGTCPAKSIRLHRYSSRSCSGYGTQVGGSRGAQGLSPLNVGGNQILAFTEKRAPRGGYCYKLTYSPAHNDSNNNNHRPQKSISYN